MPPRLGLSLLKVLLSSDEYDAAVGDVIEEFTDRARVSGVTTARRWFWRQTWKTIGHFLLGQFRETPVVTAATIVAALLLLYSKEPASLAVKVILANYHPYSYVSAPTFWFFFDIPIASFLTPLLICWLSLMVSKGREMAVMLTVSLLSAVPFAYVIFVFLCWYLQHPPPWSRYFSTSPSQLPPIPWGLFRSLVLRTLLPPVSFLIGGMLYRLSRGRPKEFLSPAGR